MALAALQALAVTGEVVPAKAVKKCKSLVPLGGPPVIGLSSRPYFTMRPAMLDHIQKMQLYNTNRWARKKQTRVCPLPRPRKRIVPLIPMRLRTLGEPDVMKMSFGTNIVPSTQQLYRISGKGGGQRDPRMYAADYKPSLPDELAQTPPGRTPPRHATASRQSVTGDGPVAPATPVGLPLGAVCSPRRLHFDTMDGVGGLAAESAT